MTMNSTKKCMTEIHHKYKVHQSAQIKMHEMSIKDTNRNTKFVDLEEKTERLERIILDLCDKINLIKENMNTHSMND